MRPEKVIVPPAAAWIGVPVEAAISKPVCTLDLILLLSPNLDVIVPLIGFIKLIPISTFP